MGRTDLVRIDFGSRFFAAQSCRVAAVAVFLCTVAWLAMSSSAQAQVVIFDGFGDADRNNDGVTDGGSVIDANDVGIPWFRVNPRWVFPPDTPNPKFLIIDDSSGPANPDGINSGNALAIDQTPQSSADFGGFFGQTITLGPNIGDKLVVSFDHRNLDLGNPDSLAGSQFTTLRFGLWQDSDNQLGTATTDGDGFAATWGEDDGRFDECAVSPVGTCNDYGIWGRVQSGAVPSAGPFPPPLDANDFSIAEEFNVAISMGGNDFETVALPDDVLMGDYNGDGNVGAADYVLWRKDPASFGGDPDGYNTWTAGFGGSDDPDNALFSDIPIVLTSPHTLSLTLERVTPDATGQDVRMEVAVDGIGFGAQPPNSAGGITTRDSFDYFMLTHNTPMDFYLIDNFQVELIAAPSGGSAAAVPEPASLQLAILLLLSALLACRRCH